MFDSSQAFKISEHLYVMLRSCTASLDVCPATGTLHIRLIENSKHKAPGICLVWIRYDHVVRANGFPFSLG